MHRIPRESLKKNWRSLPLDGFNVADHPSYSVWASMMNRCCNPSARHWESYGGRGIKVCDRWRHGEGGYRGSYLFCRDMGVPPFKRASLGRIDNDQGYSPENCRWETPAQQGRNKRNSVLITYDGETKNASAWAREYGMTPGCLTMRIKRGWSPHRALTQPVQKKRTTKTKRSRQAVSLVKALYPEVCYPIAPGTDNKER